MQTFDQTQFVALMVVELAIIAMSILLYVIERYKYPHQQTLGHMLEKEYLAERQKERI